MIARFVRWWWLAALLGLSAHAAERLEIVWPTPNPAFAQGRPIADFLQPTQSGEPESGGFGCARSGGYQYHEGIDLKPLRRDSRGEALDEIYAAMDGVVRHVSLRAGESSYGRYVVLEHPEVTPAVYTLYAHVSQVVPGIAAGVRVRRGQIIATMGRTAGGYAIPRDRAHLHFEIGVWMTRDFAGWYSGRKFGSPNQHGLWNGMNLMGIDALDFMRQWRDRRVNTLIEYFQRMEPAVRLRIATNRVPDFIQRYPALLAKEMPFGLVGGWEISCNRTGLPFRWVPLSVMEVAGLRHNEAVILSTDDELLRRQHCRSIVVTRRGQRVPGKDLEEMLQQVFGWR